MYELYLFDQHNGWTFVLNNTYSIHGVLGNWRRARYAMHWKVLYCTDDDDDDDDDDEDEEEEDDDDDDDDEADDDDDDDDEQYKTALEIINYVMVDIIIRLHKNKI